MRNPNSQTVGRAQILTQKCWPRFVLVVWGVALLVSAGLHAGEYTFTTFIGPDESPAAIDGPTNAARFNRPVGVAVDDDGNLYLGDSYNSTIRKIGLDGIVTTLAGLAGTPGTNDGTGIAARFNRPYGVAVDSAHNVYVADQTDSTIRKVTPGGVVVTLAGLAGSPGTNDGTGSSARFNSPVGVAVDPTGNLYVADFGNHTIRKVTPDGVVTTVAGLAGVSGTDDGPGLAARFNHPVGVALDNAGNLYVADDYNSTIRKITPDGVVSTLAGLPGVSGSADGTGSDARFVSPGFIAADNAGNLTVTDIRDFTVRRVTPDGTVTTLAGLAGVVGSNDGLGSDARFAGPAGVALDSGGNAFVADLNNQTIRKVTPAGLVTTLAGAVATINAHAKLGVGVAVDSAGNLYAVRGYSIERVTPSGQESTLAGDAEVSGYNDGTGSDARFISPTGLAVDGTGNVYVAGGYQDYTVRKITPAGEVTTQAGSIGISGSADGTGTSAQFNELHGLAVDNAGNVYVADTYNDTIRKITPAGVVSTLAGLAGAYGSADGTGSAARFDLPYGVATDTAGNIYVADYYNRTIRKVTPAGVVTTVAGLAGVSGSADGTGSAARFWDPIALAVDSAGNVYVSDNPNNTIRKITPARAVTTIGGLAGQSGNDNGTGSTARLNNPWGVAVDSAGKLYVADQFGGTGAATIRFGTPACPDVATIDAAIGPVGQTRQLNTSPQTAVAWKWTLIRQPAASSAKLSADNIPNPTFTPDVADVYSFRLYATNASGEFCIRTVSLTATSRVFIPPASLAVSNGQFRFTVLSPAGSTIEIQASTNLLPPWYPVATLTNITGAVPFTNAMTAPQQFFRLIGN